MSKGRKRRINYEMIIEFAELHPGMLQDEIASHFETTQSRVSYILCSSGKKGSHRGRPIKLRNGQTEDQFYWEKILHNYGLGLERGMRLNKKRILYGYDVKKESVEDDSATLNNNS